LVEDKVDEELAAAATYDEELTAATALAATKNARAESKKIDMKVSKKKFAVMENITIKNKPAKSKKIGVEFITYRQV
jgi:hypothetical protein